MLSFTGQNSWRDEELCTELLGCKSCRRCRDRGLSVGFSELFSQVDVLLKLAQLRGAAEFRLN